MGKAAWKERPGGQAVAASVQGLWVTRVSEPRTSDHSLPTLPLYRRGNRLREGQGCTPSKGHICIKPRSPEQACGHFHFTIPSTTLPSGNEIAPFLGACNDQGLDKGLEGLSRFLHGPPQCAVPSFASGCSLSLESCPQSRLASVFPHRSGPHEKQHHPWF